MEGGKTREKRQIEGKGKEKNRREGWNEKDEG